MTVHILTVPLYLITTFLYCLHGLWGPLWSWSYVQSVPFTTKVLSSNPADGEVYSMQHYVIKFVSDLRQDCGFLQVLLFCPSIKLTTTI